MTESLMHPLEQSTKSLKEKINFKELLVVSFIGIILGLITSTSLFYFSKKQKGSFLKLTKKKPKLTAGVKNTKLFPDSTEGLLQEGGIDGEGSFHLKRPGGESQNVYLTSSTIDLSKFIGKKVKVWGKTYKAEKAGWLMDVGYLEVIE